VCTCVRMALTPVMEDSSVCKEVIRIKSHHTEIILEVEFCQFAQSL
jgi:hypothetical protein